MAKIRHRFTREIMMEVQVPPRADGFGRYLASLHAQDREDGNLPPDLAKSDLSGRDLTRPI
ncbi:MAG: hypothetical protein H7145_08060 [Akkermansiaceae bacterium]|nr:hypothetical protein [Armatimonadota bacterium]